MRRFTAVNVFSDQFLGNPLAVVHDADSMTTEAMLTFARWTNLNETTFLVTPTDTEADYRVRIFTPTGELPFAGHPTLGSARAWLEAGGKPKRDDLIIQECGAGLVQLRNDGEQLAFAAPPLIRSGPVDDADLDQIAGALQLERSAILAAEWVDNGPGWVGILLASAEQVLGLEPDRARFGALSRVGVIGPYRAGAECAFEVRAFIPGVGVGEDPVTGSLNASIAQWLIGSSRAPTSYVAAQGTRLHRRGRVHIRQRDGQIWVGGNTVIGIVGEVNL